MTLEGFEVPEIQKVRDYVHFNKRPFTKADLMQATGVCKKSAAEYLRRMRHDGEIDVILVHKGANVYCKKRKKVSKTCSWTPKRKILIDLLDMIKTQKITFVDLVKKVDLSERQAHRYIEILHVLGCFQVETVTDYSVRPAHQQRFMKATGVTIPERLKEYQYYHNKMMSIKAESGVHHYE